jgi:hypothetical protein
MEERMSVCIPLSLLKVQYFHKATIFDVEDNGIKCYNHIEA